MKKFLIGAVSVILLALLADTAYYRWGLYFDFRKDNQPDTFTSTEGKDILVDTGEGLKPYEIRGVDLGAGIPGHFATDYAIDKASYLRWFRLIKEMGANTVRVYTILSPDFYEAVYEYNKGNEDPLYILHGVWVDDYIQNSHADAYDDKFLNTFMEDSRTLVDIIHGRKKMNLGHGTTNSSGYYSKDISQWVLGYILGVEWEDVTVAYTNHMEEEKSSYQGEYMYTDKNATPFEAMLARAGDNIIRYESGKYKQQRLVAFSNWPTTDPFDYPEKVDKLYMKCAQIDVEHIKATGKFKSGQFASYHVYPYYPDYLRFYEEWKTEFANASKYRQENGEYNTYGAYLEMLTAHHTMPVVISEFGVPASRGRAHMDYNTARSQGYMSETEQGKALADSYRDIMNAGCAGSAVFTWQDEWFKRTWNTMANVDLSQTAYWSDFQTNEQFFGLMSFDPGKEKSVVYTDGQVSEWKKKDIVNSNNGFELSAKYDEKFLYFRIHKEGLDFGKEKIYIPVDVTPRTGSNYDTGENLRFERPADFLIVLDGKENSRMFVQERYDAFRVMFNESYGGENPYFNPPDKDSPVFSPIYLALQLGNLNAEDEEYRMSEKFETGHFTYGNGNPDSENYNSVSDFIADGDDIEIRLPWQMLNFSNPSKMQIHDDYYENYGITNMDISEIYAGIGASGNKSGRISMDKIELEGWGKNPTYHERLKKSYYVMKELWASKSREENGN